MEPLVARIFESIDPGKSGIVPSLLLKIYSEEIEIHKRRSRKEIQRLMMGFESSFASGIRQNQFCRKHSLALSTLQHRLKKRRLDQINPEVLRRKPLNNSEGAASS